MPAEPTPQLTVVVPAYNEARRITPTLAAIRAYAQTSGRRIELLVVDDGSRDGTADVVRAFDAGPLLLRVLVNDRNRGKGHSVRRGMLEGAGDALLLSDADLSTPIEEVDRLLACLAGGAGVAIGSRDMPESVLSPPQPWTRRALAYLLRNVRRIFLLRGVRDTQCGFKLFTREAARVIFSRQTIEGFAFDVEVLVLAERLGHRICEVGVVWRNDRDSRVRVLKDGFVTVAALFRIWWTYGRTLKGAPAALAAVPRRGAESVGP